MFATLRNSVSSLEWSINTSSVSEKNQEMTNHGARVLELSIPRMTALMSGTAVSMQGRISIRQCYGRQMTLWEEQWAALCNCQINKVTMNSVSTGVSAPQSAGLWQGKVSMGCCSLIVTGMEIFRNVYKISEDCANGVHLLSSLGVKVFLKSSHI